MNTFDIPDHAYASAAAYDARRKADGLETRMSAAEARIDFLTADLCAMTLRSPEALGYGSLLMKYIRFVSDIGVDPLLSAGHGLSKVTFTEDELQVLRRMTDMARKA